MISPYVFWPIAVLIVVFAIGVVHFKNIVHSALMLILTFVGVAVVFILLEAEFLAFVQILVYAGAISILIVFAVMLTRRIDMNESNPFNKLRWISLIFCLGFFGLIVRIVLTSRISYEKLAVQDTMGAIADGLFGNYMIPFEVAAILLLIAIAGAIILTKGVKD
ncbi:MAG: NADH-quinone oxidoreductase subunit J [Ruminiclostridium sp.]|nr:NADH-quinone oxidoreductase subunit J [Ruminiclostridium sp.]